MMASHRIVRTARAVAAVIIGSLISQGIAGRGAEASVTECNSSSPQSVDLPATESQVKVKCGGLYTTFLPAELTQAYDKAYSSGVNPVPLESLIHKATLKKDEDQQTHTFSVNHSTVVENDKSVFYYCKQTTDEYCSLQIKVKKRGQTPAAKCTSETLHKILLDKQETSVMFACDATYNTLAPSEKDAFTSKDDDVVIPLENLYEGATLKKGSNYQYTLTIPKRTSSKILYYRCKAAGGNSCGVQITVEKNTANPETVPEPVTCTSTERQVELTLSAEHPGAAFTCGVDVPTLDPEDTTKVYTTSGMDNAVKLSSLFEKAGLYTDPTVAAYTYFLYVPYREKSQDLYYKCKGEDSKTCTVKVTVESNSDVVPVCRDLRGAYLSYEDFSENVRFKCDATYPDIVPADLTQVYDQDPTVASSAQAVALTTVYSGAKLVSDGDTKSPTFTLTIPPHLPRATKNIYYQCKNADNQHCTVRIRVAAKKPQLITCTDGKEEKVTITAAGEIVRFKCGERMTLSPSNDKEVFDNRDNKCSKVADLTSLVPNASLATDDDSQGKVLTFTELPSSGKALCYSCSAEAGPAGFSASFRAPQTANQCRVLIDVKSAAQGLNAHTVAGHAFILMSFAGVIFSAL